MKNKRIKLGKLFTQRVPTNGKCSITVTIYDDMPREVVLVTDDGFPFGDKIFGMSRIKAERLGNALLRASRVSE